MDPGQRIVGQLPGVAGGPCGGAGNQDDHGIGNPNEGGSLSVRPLKLKLDKVPLPLG